MVMERGEPLDEWCERAAPQLPKALIVMLDLMQAVAGLHAAGYAHRDLKPSNVRLSFL